MNNNAIVDARIRFQVAQNEINARLAIRAQIQTQHLIAVGAVIAVYAHIITGAEAPERLFDLSDRIGVLSAGVAIALPLISMYFISLYNRNDARIGILVAICRAFEKISEKHDGARLPRYFRGGAGIDEDMWLHMGGALARSGTRATVFLALISPMLVSANFFAAIRKEGVLEIWNSDGKIAIIMLLFLAAISLLNFHFWKKGNDFRYRICARLDYDQETRQVILADPR